MEKEIAIKKGYNLIALLPNLKASQLGALEKLFGFDWYKNCEINIIEQYEQDLQRIKNRFLG